MEVSKQRGSGYHIQTYDKKFIRASIVAGLGQRRPMQDFLSVLKALLKFLKILQSMDCVNILLLGWLSH